MRKHLLLVAVMMTAVSMNICAEDRNPDYTTADGKDWMYNHQIEGKRCPEEPKKESNIDLFYVYPTVCGQPTAYSQTHNGFVSIDDEGMRADTISMSSAKGAFFMTAQTFASYTQVYAPYYRQANLIDALANAGSDSLLCDYLYKGLAYQDITAALDYYFTTINPNGKRPYILAAHSQGSSLLRVAMEHYFPMHKAYLDSMVACYALGFGVGKSWCKNVEDSIGVKFANDATSTGVYISWNTEGPGGSGVSQLWPADAIAVNPLTWTTDGAAGPEANTGARLDIMVDEVRPSMYGAEISAHGTVVCREIPASQYADASVGFGDRCLHSWDYAAYWNNIAENGMQRAAKIAGWIPVQVTGLEDHTYIGQYRYKLQGETMFINEAVPAGASHWVPKTATEVQVVILASEGYKLYSGKGNAKVSVSVSEALQEGTVVVDVKGNTAVWVSQRKPDYSYAKDWLINHTLNPTEAKTIGGEPDEDTGVDLFYLYPTSCHVLDSQCVDGISDIEDQYLRSANGALYSWNNTARVFAGMVNVYAPYYRQTPSEKELELFGTTEEQYAVANDSMKNYWYERAPYQDVVDAMDYYFAHFNPNGDRPFIIAGHSHGSGMIQLLMKHYFSQEDKKPLLKNLVACYAIGFGLSKTDLQIFKDSTQCETGLTNGIQMATDAASTGVYVFWNTEGPDTPDNMVSVLWPADPAPAVNPLLWTQDTTYAPASLNLGGMREANGTIEAGLYDAKTNPVHGTVVCSSPLLTQFIGVPYMGEKSFHGSDYGLYWENLRQNANERIHTMTGKYPIEPTAIEEVNDNVNDNHNCKFMHNGQLYIRHDNIIYDAKGQVVK